MCYLRIVWAPTLFSVNLFYRQHYCARCCLPSLSALSSDIFPSPDGIYYYGRMSDKVATININKINPKRSSIIGNVYDE